MRKTIFVILLLCMPIFLFAQSGVIRSLNGTVEIKHSGTPNYVAARAGDTVREDTTVYVGLRSTAVIDVGSTVILVQPLTRLTLREIRASQDDERLNVDLRAGRVRIEVNPPAGLRMSMSVTSPSATASVRGTTFVFDTRTVRVEHGSVLFQGNRGYAVQVNAGSVSVVSTAGAASAPAPSNETQVSSPVGLDNSSRPGNEAEAVTGPGSRLGYVDVNVGYPQ